MGFLNKVIESQWSDKPRPHPVLPPEGEGTNYSEAPQELKAYGFQLTAFSFFSAANTASGLTSSTQL